MPSFGLPGVVFSTTITPPASPVGGGRRQRTMNVISTASPTAIRSPIGIVSWADQSRGPGLATSIDQPVVGASAAAARVSKIPKDPVPISAGA